MVRRSMLPLSILAVLFLSACAGEFRTVALDPMQPRESFEYASVLVSVESLMMEGSGEEMSDFSVWIIDELKLLNGVPSVLLDTESADHSNALLLKVVVDDMRKVSGAKRFWLGSMAGSANLSAEITFTEADTEEVIGKYRVTGESGGSGYSGGTNQALERTAEGIKDIMMKTFHLTSEKRRANTGV